MRIHVQNAPDDITFGISREQWIAAATRAGWTDQDVTFGSTAEDFVSGLREADTLVATTAALAERLPGAATGLKRLFVTAAGVDKIAPFDWIPSGCTLLNNRGAHGQKAGEFALMAILMLLSRIPQMVTCQRAGTWHRQWGDTASGRRLTVVGLGALGQSAAHHAKRLGMHVVGVRANPAPHPDCDEVLAPDALDALLPRTDVLLLTLPLTPVTRGLVDRRRIALLPDDAGLINMGRGLLIDQGALCDALDAGRLRGAVLDVFDPEPIPPGDRIWTTRDVIVSPHTSADDPTTYNARSLDILFANLAADRDGRPMPNRVDLARGY